MLGNVGSVNIEIRVSDKGAVSVRHFVSELDKAGQSGKQAFGGISQAARDAERQTDILRATAGMLAKSFAALGGAMLVKDIALAAARYETLGVAMHVVGNNAGYNAAQMDGYAAALQQHGIAMTESRAVLTRMAQAHIDLSHATELSRIAQDAAVIGNINSSEAFERMIHGVQSGQIDVLRTIGLNVNFEQSYAALARQLGKNAAALTEHEKMLARTNVVMEAGKSIAGTYEAAMGTAGKQINSMKRYLDDLKVGVGGVLLDSLTASVMSLTSGLKGTNAELRRLEEHKQIQGWAEDLTTGLSWVVSAGQGAARFFKQLGDNVAYVSSSIVHFRTGILELTQNNSFAGLKREFSAIIDEWKQFAQEGTDRWTAPTASMALEAMRSERYARAQTDADAAKRLETERMLAGLRAKIAEEYNAKQLAATETEKKATEAATKAADDYVSSLKREAEAMGMSKGETLALAASKLKLTDTERLEVAALIDQIDAHDDQTEATKRATEALEAQKTALKELIDLHHNYTAAMDAVNLELMSDAERQMEEIQRRHDAYREAVVADPSLSSDQVFAALAKVDRAQEQSVRKAKEAADQGSKYMQQAWEEATKSVHNSFADMFRGILDGGENTFRDLGDSILNIFKNMLAQMAAMAIAQPIIVPVMNSLGGVMGVDTTGLLGKAGMSGTGTGSAAGLLGGLAILASMSGGSGTNRGTTMTLGGASLASEGYAAYNGLGSPYLAQLASLQQTTGNLAFTAGKMAGLQTSYAANALPGLAGSGAFALTASSGSALSVGELAILDALRPIGAYTGAGAGATASNAASNTVGGMSSNAFGAWTAGVGTFIIDLLTGVEFKQALAEGVGAGVGAYAGGVAGGAAAGAYGGTVVTPVIGTAIGAIVGGLLGAMGLGEVFSGGSGEHLYNLTPLAKPGIADTTFDKTKGFDPTGWTHTDALRRLGPSSGWGNETAEWYGPIADAYAASVGAVQKSFDDMLFKFTGELPKEMQTQILSTLAATDFAAVLRSASGGEFGVSNVVGDLTVVATRYAKGLTDVLAKSYQTALGDFVITQGPGGVLGKDSAYQYLNAQAQASITEIFTRAGEMIKGTIEGGLQGGIDQMTAVAEQVNQINQAMAPITEIIETAGLTDYEKQIRTINAQFDTYGAALTAVGVDLAKYTDLEKAHQIALDQVADAQAKATQATSEAAAATAKAAHDTALNTAEQNLRQALQTEQNGFQKTIDQFGQFSDSLRDFRQGLTLGTAAGLSPEAAYQQAGAQFADITRRARLNDVEAIGQFQDVARNFVTASEGYNAHSAAFFADQAAVLQATDQILAGTDRQQDNASRQLEALTTQVSALITINDSVLSVAAAIEALRTVDPSRFAEPPAGNVYTIDNGLAGGPIQDTAATVMPDWMKGATTPTELAFVSRWAKDHHIPGYAAGGYTEGGTIMAGEMGRELINLPSRSRVYNNADTERLLSGKSSEKTEALLVEVRDALRALFSQQAAIAPATLAKLTVVAGKLDDQKRVLKQVAAEGGGRR